MKTLIIGNGISGVSCAKHLRKTDAKAEIVMVSGETDYFFSRTAIMYIFMGHMTFENTQPYENWFWDKNRIKLRRLWVTKIDTDKKKVTYSDGNVEAYDNLVLALGSKSNKFGWKGQDLDGVQGLYSYQDLQLLEKNYSHGIKHAVIVGGGLIGVELAEMLMTRGVKITFVVREKAFWDGVLPKEEANFVGRHVIEDHHVNILFEKNLDEIIPGDDGRVRAIKVKETGDIIECDFVGLTAGVSPNISFLEGSNIECDRGVLVDNFLQTNIDNVYALGDCAQHREAHGRRRNLEQVWYTGRIMGEALGKTLGGKKTAYTPGHWYNSAKFFDIEYQTYGWVLNKLQEGEDHFYWESDDKLRCLKIVFNKENRQFIGLNIFGIRLRHELIDRLLNEKATVDQLLEQFNDLNFDPELYRSDRQKIIDSFNRHQNTNIILRKKSSKNIFAKAFTKSLN